MKNRAGAPNIPRQSVLRILSKTKELPLREPFSNVFLYVFFDVRLFMPRLDSLAVQVHQERLQRFLDGIPEACGTQAAARHDFVALADSNNRKTIFFGERYIQALFKNFFKKVSH